PLGRDVTSAQVQPWQIVRIAEYPPDQHLYCLFSPFTYPVGWRTGRAASRQPAETTRCPSLGWPAQGWLRKPVGSAVVTLATERRAALLALIKELAVVHGDVTLSSGQRASWYIDLRRLLLDGRAAPLAGQVMLDVTAGLDYEAVGGLTLGADPVATAM